MNVDIRPSKATDLLSIVKIYNQAILARNCIAILNEVTVNNREEWLLEHPSDKYPVLVAEYKNNVVGWVSLSPYRKGREALEKTVEVSYFVDSTYHKKGIGTMLLNAILKRAHELGYKTIFAILFDINQASIKLLEKFKFEKWGRLPDVLEIDGNVYSHLYYGRKVF